MRNAPHLSTPLRVARLTASELKRLPSSDSGESSSHEGQLVDVTTTPSRSRVYAGSQDAQDVDRKDTFETTYGGFVNQVQPHGGLPLATRGVAIVAQSLTKFYIVDRGISSTVYKLRFAVRGTEIARIFEVVEGTQIVLDDLASLLQSDAYNIDPEGILCSTFAGADSIEHIAWAHQVLRIQLAHAAKIAYKYYMRGWGTNLVSPTSSHSSLYGELWNEANRENQLKLFFRHPRVAQHIKTLSLHAFQTAPDTPLDVLAPVDVSDITSSFPERSSEPLPMIRYWNKNTGKLHELEYPTSYEDSSLWVAPDEQYVTKRKMSSIRFAVPPTQVYTTMTEVSQAAEERIAEMEASVSHVSPLASTSQLPRAQSSAPPSTPSVNAIFGIGADIPAMSTPWKAGWSNPNTNITWTLAHSRCRTGHYSFDDGETGYGPCCVSGDSWLMGGEGDRSLADALGNTLPVTYNLAGYKNILPPVSSAYGARVSGIGTVPVLISTPSTQPQPPVVGAAAFQFASAPPAIPMAAPAYANFAAPGRMSGNFLPMAAAMQPPPPIVNPPPPQQNPCRHAS
ncbi:hypothetical protein C8R43DRAFT_1140630 [Mycena crocata]|nr:hypothetical protein C8R43DRAFT_1140630 [Mycena crocata]